MTCKNCGKNIMKAVDCLCFECLKAVLDMREMNLFQSIGEYFAFSSLDDSALGKRFAQIILSNIATHTIEFKVSFLQEFLNHIDMAYEKAFKESSCDES